MLAWTRSDVRHLVMRLALAFVLGWFGVQELHKPGDWGVFVPNFVGQRVPAQVEHLVLLHGFLLLLAATAVGLGVCYVLGSLLAAGMLAEVVLGLWIDGSNISDLVIRDIGLLGLAAALAIDPVRTWHLDEWLLARLRGARQPARRRKTQPAVPLSARVVWRTRAASGAALVVALLMVAALLRVTGTSGAAPANIGGLQSARAQPSPVASASPTPAAAAAAPGSAAQTQPAAHASPVPTPTVAAPAASTGPLFATWQYRQYAFEVYPGATGPDAQQALSGFDLSMQDQGATVLLTFKALSSRYHDATVTVDKGNTAYFVETSMRDDPNGQENELNDDGIVVVNPQGYILQS